VLFLLAVRRHAAATVFHYHAAGMGAYVMASPLRRWAAHVINAAEIAVQPGASCPPDAERLGAREVRYIPTGIPDPGNRVGGRDRPPSGRFRVLVVGHLCPEKGTGLLARIAERLKDFADIEIMGAWRSAAYRMQMEPALCHDHIRFLGVCEGEEKWEAFARADALLFPSFRETQGLVAVEAMACGLPVVASAIDGIRDSIRDGVEGRLVPPGDADGFADAVCTICSDIATWRAMSEACRKRYLAEFTLPVYIERMRQVFLDCLPVVRNGGRLTGREKG
jgi:glycosyltransferase involved in cell wall biosynthesis